MALPFTLKKYLKTKERIMETQIFHHAQAKIIMFQNSSYKNRPTTMELESIKL
jgi:hypothetical protein